MLRCFPTPCLQCIASGGNVVMEWGGNIGSIKPTLPIMPPHSMPPLHCNRRCITHTHIHTLIHTHADCVLNHVHYLRVCVCVCVCVFVCVCECVSVCVCVDTIDRTVCMCVCGCMYWWMWERTVCMCVCVSVCVCVDTSAKTFYASIYVYICTHTQTL